MKKPGCLWQYDYRSAKAEGHTRVLIAEHGDTKFHRSEGGVLHLSSRTTQGGI